MEVWVGSEEVPAARYILARLRDESTNSGLFREWMRRAGVLLGFAASRSLEWKSVTVRTPLGVEAEELDLEAPPLLVGVLGASLHLLEGVEYAYPGAPVGLVAARRIEEPGSVRIEVYYSRLPRRHEGPTIIVDPMLATGYTMAEAARLARGIGSRRVIAVSVIASLPGLSYLERTGLVDAVYTLAVDQELDHRFFIVPGLGDAGDRSLGVSP